MLLQDVFGKAIVGGIPIGVIKDSEGKGIVCELLSLDVQKNRWTHKQLCGWLDLDPKMPISVWSVTPVDLKLVINFVATYLGVEREMVIKQFKQEFFEGFC